MFTTIQDLKAPVDLQSSSGRNGLRKLLGPRGGMFSSACFRCGQLKSRGKPSRTWNLMDWKATEPSLNQGVLPRPRAGVSASKIQNCRRLEPARHHHNPSFLHHCALGVACDLSFLFMISELIESISDLR